MRSWRVMPFCRLDLGALLAVWLTVRLLDQNHLLQWWLLHWRMWDTAIPHTLLLSACCLRTDAPIPQRFVSPVSTGTGNSTHTEERCMGLEQPEDMFMVHILPPLHAVGQDGSLCCLIPRTCKVLTARFTIPRHPDGVITLHRLGIRHGEAGHFTVDHVESHGKCWLTRQSCRESSCRYCWLEMRKRH